MIRALLLILIVLGSFAFAQTEDKAPKDLAPAAIKFDEFGKATNGNVEMRIQAFFTEMNKNPTSQACIVNYGTNREISMREKQIKNAINLFKYDSFRITLVRGGMGELRTVFWIVPPGAEMPMSKSEEIKDRDETPKSIKLEEFQKLTDGYLKIKIHRFFKELKNKPTSKGYIINFGNDREIARRERQIKGAIDFFKYDPSSVTLIRGGVRKVIKTQFWIVPTGVEAPKPKT